MSIGAKNYFKPVGVQKKSYSTLISHTFVPACMSWLQSVLSPLGTITSSLTKFSLIGDQHHQKLYNGTFPEIKLLKTLKKFKEKPGWKGIEDLGRLHLSFRSAF